jgi:hypothetical protein
MDSGDLAFELSELVVDGCLQRKRHVCIRQVIGTHRAQRVVRRHIPLCHDRPDAEHTACQRLGRSALGLISRSYTSRNVSQVATPLISHVYSLRFLS